MTPDDQTPVPDEDQVRRLLAALGEQPVAMPPAVAARLDGTLADLAEQRAEERAEEPATTVTELPRRERPRRWPQLLVAAAAVSVLGLGVGELVEGSGTDATTAATTESADAPADAAGGAAQEDAEAAPEPFSAGDSPQSEPPGAAMLDRRQRLSSLSFAPTSLTRLDSASLAPDVQRLADFTLADTAAERATPKQLRDGGAACALPDAGAGDTVYAVRLDGEPATLLLHRGEDGRRLAEVFACDDASAPVATTTVDAR